MSISFTPSAVKRQNYDDGRNVPCDWLLNTGPELLVSVIAIAVVVAIGAFSVIIVRTLTTLATLVAAFFSLEHLGLLGDSFVATHDRVTDHGIVVTEVVFQLSQGLALHSTFIRTWWALCTLLMA